MKNNFFKILILFFFKLNNLNSEFKISNNINLNEKISHEIQNGCIYFYLNINKTNLPTLNFSNNQRKNLIYKIEQNVYDEIYNYIINKNLNHKVIFKNNFDFEIKYIYKDKQDILVFKLILKSNNYKKPTTLESLKNIFTNNYIFNNNNEDYNEFLIKDLFNKNYDLKEGSNEFDYYGINMKNKFEEKFISNILNYKNNNLINDIIKKFRYKMFQGIDFIKKII